jgi:NAD(P)-dependent dehydrogenase (short-subunit alcohol dehydrogenase family)
MVENGAFLDIRPDQWQAHLDLNLTGNFHVGQAAARLMVGQEPAKRPGCERGVRGKILFNSSWVQDTPWPEGCCYGVAKAGLALMAKAMAQELAVYGIRVNIIAPGIVLAGLSKVCYETDPKYAPRATAAIPLREFGTPEQCADAFLFLASDESDYITGISLLVDGGASLPRRD